jgi:hypothetical protein
VKIDPYGVVVRTRVAGVSGLRELLSIGRKEAVAGNKGRLLRRCQVDVVDLLFGLGLHSLRHLVEALGGLADPARLFFRIRVYLS